MIRLDVDEVGICYDITSSQSTRKHVIQVLKSLKVCIRRYLDIGCGDATLTSLISKVVGAVEAYGLDIISIAVVRAKDKINVIQAEATRLPFKANTFDLVTAIEVIEHLPYGDSLLLEVYRVLKSGGLFVISTPNLASWINRILILLGYQPSFCIEPSCIYVIGLPRGPRRKSSYSGHISAYTLRALMDILRIYGFQIVRVYGYPLLDYKKAVTQNFLTRLLYLLDKLFSKFASLATGIIVIAKKP